MYTFFDTFKLVYQEGAFSAFILAKEQEEVMGLLFSTNPTYYLFQGLFYGLSLAGAIFMWNFRKPGFHMYTVAQIVLLILQQVYIPSLPFPAFEMLISALFVYFYARHLSLMH
jgi:hypothetical protein